MRPFRIRSFKSLAISGALTLSITGSLIGQSQASLVSKIDSIVLAHYPVDQPGAAFAVVVEDRVIHQSGSGIAQMEDESPITSETIFRIGSITKQFTAICVLRARDHGLLSLNDTVSNYFPELLGSMDEITIHHVLCHQSGIPDLPRIPEMRSLMAVDSSPAELLAIIGKQELEFDPGTRYSYSNSGYVILGAILEKLTALSLDDIFHQWIIDPLGMDHTYCSDSPPQDEIARGYFQREEGFVKAPEIHSSLLYAAGCMWSTCADMAKWNAALGTEKVLSTVSIEEAFRPKPLKDGSPTDYGYGFRSCFVNGSPSIEHGGGVFGYACYGIRIEAVGVYVIVLTNFERGNAFDDVAAELAALAASTPYERPLRPLPMSRSSQQAYAGCYMLSSGDSLMLEPSDTGMLMKRSGRADISLIHMGDDRFLLEGSLDDTVQLLSDGQTKLIWKPRRAMARVALRCQD